QKWHQGSRRFAPCFCWLSFLARFCYSFTLSSYKKFFYGFICASLSLTALGTQPAYAASLTVDSAADTVGNDGACTLREAITNANDNAATYPDCAAGSGASDTITFAANYTITLGSQLPAVTSQITITGNGVSNTIIQANAAPNIATYRVFEVSATGNLTLDGLTVRHGRCNGSCATDTTNGGGIYSNGTLTVTNSALSNNSANQNGGGIYNSGTLTVTNSALSNNSANSSGGGIYNRNGTLTVTNSTLSGNRAAFGDGGGIYNDNGTLTVTNSTLSGNSAGNGGGGIYNFFGTLTVTNSTISGNSAGWSGGGIYNYFGTATVTNSTISGNSAGWSGGIYNYFGTLNYSNTIIANSAAGGDCNNNFGTIGTNVNNLVEDGSCPALLNGDPNLGPLQDNGGPTQTHALLTGSTAIDAGNAAVCAAAPVNNLDQRGVARPQGAGCDIGSYEVDASFPTVVFTSLVPSYTTGPGNFTVTYSENVYDPAGDSNPDDVTNPANYIVAEDGANGAFDTASCAGGLAGDDTQLTITGITYNAALYTATVTLSAPAPDGTYRLFVCGTTSIVDPAMNELNNGLSDYTFDFIVGAAPTTPGSSTGEEDEVTASALPTTGFAPDRVTALPAQPAELTYAKMGDIWLEIPSQKIKSNIVGVPQNADDTWSVDWLGNDTGWLNGTAFPTWNGNSVLTAHVTNADGLPGPFADLKSLKYGDQIIVHLYGQQYIYEVRASRLSRPYAVNYAFESLPDSPHLTLITCQGYIPISDTYLFRRVVRAVLVEVR
ncbi:sortase, partial [Chloroflexi bacterium CFX5]|nr:sortase [Chloroflexi bacterium CFX5]